MNKWNNIKEVGMPNHENAVLICNSDIPETPIVIGIKSDEKEFYILEIKGFSDKATHWMELPEKPKN